MKNFTRMNPLALATALSFASVATGCAVGPIEVRERAALKTDEITQASVKAQSQQKMEPAWLRIPGNFLGSAPRPIDTTTNLPAQYRDVTLNFGSNAFGSLATVVANIRAKTGLLVRLNPDVNVGIAALPQPLAPLQVSSVPLPGGSTAAPGQILPGLATSAPPNLSSPGRVLPLTHEGDLSEYLNKIASILDIAWEYSNGEVYMFRTMTREFKMMVSPGSISYTDNMSGNSGSGSTQFGSSNTTTDAKQLNPWASLDSGIKTMLSSTGKHSINESSGTITVSDTKSVIDRVERYLRHENSTLRAQVSIDIREITVQLDDQTEVGLDLNLIYRKLNASTGSPDWTFNMAAPSTLTSSAAGVSSFNVVKPSAYWAGSSAAVQALNSIGHVIADTTDSIVTTNRVPGRRQEVTDRAYLAATTPATGGGTSGGVGVPGLTPGLVSYGTNLTVVPTIGEDNSVLLQMFDARSDLLRIDSVSTGSGQTLQQINTPTLKRRKYSQNFVINQGETLIIVGSNSDSINATTAFGLTGASAVGKRIKSISVVLVTPRILQGS